MVKKTLSKYQRHTIGRNRRLIKWRTEAGEMAQLLKGMFTTKNIKWRTYAKRK